MTDEDPQQPGTPAAISIQDIIQIRAILGDADQDETVHRDAILTALDQVILNFATSLTQKGN